MSPDIRTRSFHATKERPATCRARAANSIFKLSKFHASEAWTKPEGFLAFITVGGSGLTKLMDGPTKNPQGN
jgi:hypothetical protein